MSGVVEEKMKEFESGVCECMRSRVRLFGTPWAVAHQDPWSMEFPRQEYWDRWPFPTPRNKYDGEPQKLSWSRREAMTWGMTWGDNNLWKFKQVHGCEYFGSIQELLEWWCKKELPRKKKGDVQRVDAWYRYFGDGAVIVRLYIITPLI